MAGCGQIRAVVRGPWGVPPGSHAATHWEFDHDACPPRVCTVPARRPDGLFPGLGVRPPIAADEATAAPATSAATTPAEGVGPRSPNEKCLSCHDDAEMRPMPARDRECGRVRFPHTSARLRRLPRDRRYDQAPAQQPRQGDVRRLHRVPRGRDHSVPGQRAREGEGRRDRSLPGLPRQHPHDVRSSDPTRRCPRSTSSELRRCHKDMMDGYLAACTPSALLVSGLTDVAPSCSDCHGSHDIQRHDQPVPARRTRRAPRPAAHATRASSRLGRQRAR